MKKLLSIIILTLLWSNISVAEEKDNSHLQNKFDTYPSCEEHVEVLFKEKYNYYRDYPYLFPENKLVSCNPEINLPNEWVKTITPIKKFAKVKLDNANIRAYPFVGSLSGFHVGNLEIGEVIFIDSLVYTSLEKVDEWLRRWYSFKVKGKIFYIWEDSVDLDYKNSDNQETSAYEIGEEVFLNACGADPNTYYDKPLNIKNILIEVPNKITNLKKSKYNREFQALATSTIDLGNDKIDVSVSNFRDLTIKNSNGDVLTTRKISGASSLYELKHKGKVVAWGAGWHKNCGNSFDTDFTAFRIFIPIKKDNKISIEQKLISLNINPFYKATINSEKLIIADAVEISGSARAANYYYAGQKFYQLDHLDGIKSIDTYEELHKKIDVLQISPARMVNILSGYYETEVLNKYTKANFDNIYKELLKEHWNISYEFDNGDNLEKSISDLSISDEFKKALIALRKREMLWEDFPPIAGAIPSLKNNCFKNDTYETLKELVRNCYFFHSSYVMDYGFSDPKWFAVQTEFKDSKDLLNEDKDKRFEEYLRNGITDMKSFVWGEDSMDGTVVDDLLSIFERANGGYKISKDNRYVVISGCEYKACYVKGLVFIDTESYRPIALIRHLDYQPDKTNLSTQSDDWLILSDNYRHEKYEDLPKEFLDAVDEWKSDQDLPSPRIIRYVGGSGTDIELVKK